jgi:tetratricopeptide (TPR) repeat protein
MVHRLLKEGSMTGDLGSAVSVVLLTATFTPSPGFATGAAIEIVDESAQAAPAERRVLSQQVGERFQRALAYRDAGDAASALAELDAATEDEAVSPYEAGLIHLVAGHALVELDDDEAATRRFRAALESGGLLPNHSYQASLEIARLEIAQGRIQAGISSLESGIDALEAIDHRAARQIAETYADAGRYEDALPYAERFVQAGRAYTDTVTFGTGSGQPLGADDRLFMARIYEGAGLVEEAEAMRRLARRLESRAE